MERKVRVYEWNDTYISPDGRVSKLLDQWQAERVKDGMNSADIEKEISIMRANGRILSMRYPCYGVEKTSEDPFGIY